jgi:hypothetical protein
MTELVFSKTDLRSVWASHSIFQETFPEKYGVTFGFNSRRSKKWLEAIF